MTSFQTSSMDVLLVEVQEEVDSASKRKKRAILIVVATLMLTTALIIGLCIGLSSSPSSSPQLEVLSADGSDEGCFATLQFPDSMKINPRRSDSVLARAARGECPSSRPTRCPAGKKNTPLLILSLDGFRAEYLLRNMTANIGLMQKCGSSTDYMRPVFPSKTFPNHYSIVTGLYAESHGIIDNYFYDPEYKEFFSYGGKNLSDNRWWGGEPIYNTAKKQGLKVATMMWTGTDVNIQNMRPDICYNYNKSVTYAQRTNEILHYFDDAETSPDLVLLYFEQPDSAGHSVGPFESWVNGNLTLVDSLVGSLIDGLDERGFGDCFNLVVVADHGMEKFDCSHVVNISSYINTTAYNIYTGPHARLSSAYTSTNPIPVEETLSKLRCVNYDEKKDWYARFHAKADLPKRYHFSNNRRIDEIVADMQQKYTLEKFKGGCYVSYGNHGSDNTFKSMHSIFVAFGSTFKQTSVEPFENIHLYNLFADVLGIKAVPNNGTFGVFYSMLTNATNLTANNPLEFRNLGKKINEMRVDESGCQVPPDLEKERRRQYSDCVPSKKCPGMNDLNDLDDKLALTPAESNESVTINAPLGIPLLGRADESCLLVQRDYVTRYDELMKLPVWTSFTAFHTGQESNVLNGKYLVDREFDGCVRPDVRIPTQTNCSAYSNPSRNIEAAFLYPPGLIPKAERISDAYLQSNLVPMYTEFKDVWKETLHLVEQYIEKYKALNVLMGPIYDYNADGLADDPKDLTKFVDESETVPIPSHYFVVAVRCNDGNQQSQSSPTCLTTSSAISFVMPHVRDTGNCWKYRVSDYIRENVARVRDVELLLNATLMTSLDDVQRRARIVTNLEEELWPGLAWTDHKDQYGCPIRTINPTCYNGYSNNMKPLLLISLDGVRPDYITKERTPYLQKLMECGVSMPYMLPVYPTHTFPNHYTIVTGQYPESHGIVDNNMYDMTMNLSFSLGSSTANDPRWWIGEPLWVTLEKNNKTSMAYFWPGSDVKIHGYRPTVYKKYDGAVPNSLRVSTVLDWLSNSTGVIPELVLLYFSDVDSAGHDGGHDSVQVRESLEAIDDTLRQLMDGLYLRRLDDCINIIITSDHGMSEISCSRSITLTDYLSADVLAKTYQYQGSAPRIANQYYKSGSYYYKVNETQKVTTANLTGSLNCESGQMIAFDKLLAPRPLHYTNSDRIDDVLLIAADTWLVNRNAPYCPIKGQHGWLQRYDSMKAIFLGYGPSFKTRAFFNESFENIELLNLMSFLTRVPVPDNNGTKGSLDFLLEDTRLPLPPLPIGAAYDQCPYPQSLEEYNQRAEQVSIGCSCLLYNDSRLNLTDDEKSFISEVQMSHGLPILTGTSHGQVCSLYQQKYVLAFDKKLKLPIYASFLKLLNADAPSAEWAPTCLRPDVRLTHDQQHSCTDYYRLTDYNMTAVTLFPQGQSDSLYDDTQIITNIVPMYKTFYSEIWRPLLTRFWTKKLNLDIIVGPIFDYNGDGLADISIKKFAGNVSIPSHYFLIVLHCPGGRCEDTSYATVSYILPNIDFKPSSICQTAEQYIDMHIGRIRDVELLTNLQFLTKKNTQAAIRTRVRTPNAFSI